MTQENEFYELGLEIKALENTSSPDQPEQNEPVTQDVSEGDETVSGDETDDQTPAEEDTAGEGREVPEEVSDPLVSISRQVQDLALQFESKLKYDAHKNKIIDELHQALQEYRQGLLHKYLQRVIIDVIKIIDDMRKFASHYSYAPLNEENVEKILKFITNTASDLEDLFAWEGITPFTCEGEILDPVRQRVVEKIETDDPARDKTIAKRVRPGYEHDGKMLRHEMVNIYVFSNNHIPNDRNI